MKSLLEEAIEAWQDTRNGVIAEVTNTPSSEFAFRPVDGVRGFGELVAHILEVSLMMVGELTREDGNFRRKPYPKLIEEYAGSLYAAPYATASRPSAAPANCTCCNTSPASTGSREPAWRGSITVSGTRSTTAASSPSINVTSASRRR